MKILCCPYDLVVCGTVVNAIELAAALRDLHGHEVLLFAAPGPMIKLVEEKGLRFLPAPASNRHPSRTRMHALRDLVRRERPDLIHAWDWQQCLDAYYGEHLLMRVPLVVSDMCMHLQRILPKMLPTTFGTPKLLDLARADGYRLPELMLPPVDVHLNAPDVFDPQPFRERFGIKDSDITLVIVSRLDTHMKGDGLYRTLDAVSNLAHNSPLRLVIVGDGDARAELERIAAKTNGQLGRAVVIFTGALFDPRPAYAAADIVLGMGGSALRGMAFGKPVIVIGVQGFSAPFTPETAESFYYEGIYGVGDGSFNNARLIGDIRGLTEHPDKLRALGEFSRQFVLRYFALETVSARFADFCELAITNQPRLSAAIVDGLRTAAVWARERRFRQ